MPAASAMVVIVIVVVMMPVAGADMMVMRLLRRAGIGFVADDLRAVLAELTVHRRAAVRDFADALDKGVEQQRMVAQIGRFGEFDLGMAQGRLVGRGIDALDQDAGEQEVRKDDDTAEAEPRGAV